MSQAENTAAVATPKAPSKMDQAKELYAKIKTEPLAEGDSVRKQFIARAQSEIGLTKAGAITYYNNIRGAAEAGKPLYYKGKKEAAPAAPEASNEEGANASGQGLDPETAAE